MDHEESAETGSQEVTSPTTPSGSTGATHGSDTSSSSSSTDSASAPAPQLTIAQQLAAMREKISATKAAQEKAIKEAEAENERIRLQLETEKADIDALTALRDEELRSRLDLAKKAQAARDRKRKLEEETRVLSHQKQTLGQGTVRSLELDVYGRKSFSDVDGRTYSVRDIKSATIEAMDSLFSRRLTDIGRHDLLYGEDDVKLDSDLVRTVVVRMAQTQLFGLRVRDTTSWATSYWYNKVSNLPAMTEKGFKAMHTGHAVDLRWFLVGGWGPISDLNGIIKAMEQMEIVFMVQFSMEFEGMNQPFLEHADHDLVVQADVQYLVYWIQATLDEFNEIVRQRYVRICEGFPERLDTVTSVRNLWTFMLNRIYDHLDETKYRLFHAQLRSKTTQVFSMELDVAASGGKSKLTPKKRVSIKTGDSSSDDDDSSSGSSVVSKSTKSRKRAKKDLSGATTPKQKVAKVTPPKKEPPAQNTPWSRSYCGEHLRKLAGLGNGCTHSTACRFTHVTSIGSADMELVNACMDSNFGCKLGKTKAIKLWNQICNRKKLTDQAWTTDHVFAWEEEADAASVQEDPSTPSQDVAGPGRGRGGGRGANGRGRFTPRGGRGGGRA